MTDDVGMQWRYYPEESSQTGERIYDSAADEVKSEFTDIFDVERSGPDGNGHESFTLVVKEMTKDLGGDYTCQLIVQSSVAVTAELVALST